MSNIFASLASGTKFSGKRNQEAIDIFRSKGSSTCFGELDSCGTNNQFVPSASKQSKQVIDIFGTNDDIKGWFVNRVIVAVSFVLSRGLHCEQM